MRYLSLLLPFLLLSPALAAKKKLTVHEWGTFTSVAGEDGSAVDGTDAVALSLKPGLLARQSSRSSDRSST